MLKNQSSSPSVGSVVHLKKSKKISRTSKPDDMSVEEWQIALRRQFGVEQNFICKRDPNRPDWDFSITNPESGGTYRVAIRGRKVGDNYCSCPDFSTNTLLTCKHIEFTLAKLEKSKKSAQVLKKGFIQHDFSSVFVRYGEKKEIAFKPAPNLSSQLAKLTAQFFDEQGFFKHDTFGQFPTFNQSLKKVADKVHVYDDVYQLVRHKMDQQLLADCIDRYFPQGSESGAFNGLLSVPMYPYQREGALFAARNGRVLIADDMGLGKTIQAIAAAEILARCMQISRILIVCPTSLKHQWQSEIEKFSQRQALVINGLLKKRQEAYAAPSFFKIINYDIVHRDKDMINAWQPDLVILDEAQRIKNWKTRTAKNVKLIQSRFAIVLTGTPLENRLEELHSIVSFIDKQRLGPLFKFLHNHQLTDEFGKITGYHNLDQIGASLQPILIRRHKSQVLQELPERIDKTFFVEMTDEQWTHHDENYDLVCRLVNRWRRQGFLSDDDQKRLMIFLQNMRMSCNSTYLLDQKTDHGRKIPELMILLKEILEEPNVKIVIFSQWVRTHELIIRHLEKSNLPYIFFHGGVESSKRKGLVHQFQQDDKCRLFLSTDAGGVGLNLQNASVVVNMDQPWNPAVLEQRIGRVHRMGQKQVVRAINFVAEQTIEESMLSILKFKKGLFSGVLDGGAKEIRMEGSRLKRFMETIESMTQDQDTRHTTENAAQPESMSDTAREENQPDSPSRPNLADSHEDNTSTAQSSRPVSSSQDQNWDALISSGMDLMEKFITQLAKPKIQKTAQANATPTHREWFQIDSQTNQFKLTIPVPKPETIDKLGRIFMLAKELIG